MGVGEAEFQAGLRPYILVRPRCHVKDEGSCTLLPQFVIPNRAEGAVRNLLLDAVISQLPDGDGELEHE